MRRTMSVIAAVAAVGAVVAGCGSGSDASAPPAATTAAAATTTTAATTAAAGPTAKVSGPGYDQTFEVTSCKNAGETDLKLSGAATGGATLSVDVGDGTGSLSITGGDEQDSVALQGVVDTMSVGDAGDFTGTGTFTEGLGSSDTSFTLSGSCAGAP